MGAPVFDLAKFEMCRDDQTGRPLPQWMLDHFGGDDTVLPGALDELLEDYAQLMAAIEYWQGRSESRVAEFVDLAAEIENEMKQLVEVLPQTDEIRNGDDD